MPYHLLSINVSRFFCIYSGIFACCSFTSSKMIILRMVYFNVFLLFFPYEILMCFYFFANFDTFRLNFTYEGKRDKGYFGYTVRRKSMKYQKYKIKFETKTESVVIMSFKDHMICITLAIKGLFVYFFLFLNQFFPQSCLLKKIFCLN